MRVESGDKWIDLCWPPGNLVTSGDGAAGVNLGTGGMNTLRIGVLTLGGEILVEAGLRRET